ELLVGQGHDSRPWTASRLERPTVPANRQESSAVATNSSREQTGAASRRQPPRPTVARKRNEPGALAAHGGPVCAAARPAAGRACPDLLSPAAASSGRPAGTPSPLSSATG